MQHEKHNFDQDAAAWDAKPGRLKVAADIAKAIQQQINLKKAMDVLDFGCGTGLLTLALHPLVRSITGVDSSRGMLDVFRQKIKGNDLTGIKAVHLDLDRGDILTGSYDLIVSSMTLHHIKEIGPLLKQFHHVLRPSGILCIADLDLDCGRFHESNDGVFHFGFNRPDLRHAFMDAGFTDVHDIEAARIKKPDDEGGFRLFTVFLMIGHNQQP